MGVRKRDSAANLSLLEVGIEFAHPTRCALPRCEITARGAAKRQCTDPARNPRLFAPNGGRRDLPDAPQLRSRSLRVSAVSLTLPRSRVCRPSALAAVPAANTRLESLTCSDTRASSRIWLVRTAICHFPQRPSEPLETGGTPPKNDPRRCARTCVWLGVGRSRFPASVGRWVEVPAWRSPGNEPA